MKKPLFEYKKRAFYTSKSGFSYNKKGLFSLLPSRIKMMASSVVTFLSRFVTEKCEEEVFSERVGKRQ